MSALDDILNHRFGDKDGYEKAGWKGERGNNKDGNDGPWHEQGDFCWKDHDPGNKWEGKRGDDCGPCGNEDPEGCGELTGVLASLTKAVDVVEAAIKELDCPQCGTAQVDSFENDSLAA
jgi:hypothetical protein